MDTFTIETLNFALTATRISESYGTPTYEEDTESGMVKIGVINFTGTPTAEEITQVEAFDGEYDVLSDTEFAFFHYVDMR